MTYTINNQHLDNLDHQVYLLELAVVITKTLNIHCSHIDMVLCWDSFPHSTIQYTVAWKEITLLMYLYLALYTIKNIPKSTTLQLFLLYLGVKARFRRRIFHVPNIMSILFDSNVIKSGFDSDGVFFMRRI